MICSGRFRAYAVSPEGEGHAALLGSSRLRFLNHAQRVNTYAGLPKAHIALRVSPAVQKEKSERRFGKGQCGTASRRAGMGRVHPGVWAGRPIAARNNYGYDRTGGY